MSRHIYSGEMKSGTLRVLSLVLILLALPGLPGATAT
jgi:hypothetical protein